MLINEIYGNHAAKNHQRLRPASRSLLMIKAEYDHIIAISNTSARRGAISVKTIVRTIATITTIDTAQYSWRPDVPLKSK